MPSLTASQTAYILSKYRQELATELKGWEISQNGCQLPLLDDDVQHHLLQCYDEVLEDIKLRHAEPERNSYYWRMHVTPALMINDIAKLPQLRAFADSYTGDAKDAADIAHATAEALVGSVLRRALFTAKEIGIFKNVSANYIDRMTTRNLSSAARY